MFGIPWGAPKPTCPNCGSREWKEEKDFECPKCGYHEIESRIVEAGQITFCKDCGCTYSDGCPTHKDSNTKESE